MRAHRLVREMIEGAEHPQLRPPRHPGDLGQQRRTRGLSDHQQADEGRGGLRPRPAARPGPEVDRAHSAASGASAAASPTTRTRVRIALPGR